MTLQIMEKPVTILKPKYKAYLLSHINLPFPGLKRIVYATSIGKAKSEIIHTYFQMFEDNCTWTNISGKRLKEADIYFNPEDLAKWNCASKFPAPYMVWEENLYRVLGLPWS